MTTVQTIETPATPATPATPKKEKLVKLPKKPAAAAAPAATPEKAKPAAPPKPLTREEIITGLMARYEAIKQDDVSKDVPVDSILVIDELDSRMTPMSPSAAFIASLKDEATGEVRLISPILLAPFTDKETGKKVLIMVAGRNRLKGYKQLEQKTIPSTIRSLSIPELIRAAVVENKQRKNLTAMDTAVSMARMKSANFNQSDIARDLGVSNAMVTQMLYLLKLDPRVQNLVAGEQMGPSSGTLGRHLYEIKDMDVQFQVATKIVDDIKAGKPWTVDKLKNHIAAYQQRLAEKAERDKAKEKAKAAKAKNGGEDSETEETEEEEVVTFHYEPEEVTPVDANYLHALMEQTKTNVIEWEGDADIYTHYRELKKDAAHKAAIKLALEIGRLEGLEMATGFKPLPARVTKAAEANETE